MMVNPLFQLRPDFLQFLSGLSFFVLAAVAFALRRIVMPKVSWLGLAWFGLAFGCAQWIDLAQGSLGSRTALAAAQSFLHFGAMMSLVWFSCAEDVIRLVRRRWLRVSIGLLPLALLAAVTRAGGMAEYGESLFFALAAAATYASLKIWKAAQSPRPDRSALGLATISMVMLALAFLAGSPKVEGVSTWALNRDVFERVAGFSIAGVYAAVTLILASALWQAYQYAMEGRASRAAGLWRQKSFFGIHLVGALFLLTVSGWILVDQGGERVRRIMENHLMTRALATGAALDSGLAAQLTGRPEDVALPEYRQLRDQLTRIQRANPDIKNIYLYGPRDGGSINYVASEQVVSGESIGPGTVYADELDEEDKAFFRDGSGYVSKPYVDAWGTWVSALVGLLPDTKGPGRLRMALGLDIAAGEVEHQVAEGRFAVILVFMLLAVLVINILLFRQHWWDRARRLAINQSVLLELSREDQASYVASLATLTQTVAGSLDVTRVSVWRFSMDRTTLVCEDAYDTLEGRHERGVKLVVSDYPAYFQALEQRRVLAVSDIRLDERTRELEKEYLAPQGILAMMDTQILRDGACCGIFCVENVDAVRQWTDEEVQLALGVADMLALMMEKRDRRQVELEKYESEERYRGIFENSPEAILVLDTVGRLLEINRSGVEWAGFSKAELSGKPVLEWPFLPEGARERVAERVQRIGEEAGSRADEIELLSPGGGRRVGLLQAVSLRDPAGRPMGGLVMISDITERKKAEETLRGTLNELERHNRLMSGRESRVLELKAEVNALCEALGRAPTYRTAAGAAPVPEAN